MTVRKTVHTVSNTALASENNMDVTLDIQTIDAHPDFMDIRLETLIEICQAFAIPEEMFDGIEKSHWVRLYRDGSYDVLSSE